MLDYRLDAETEALRKTVREFAQEVIAPQIGEFYERDEFPTEIVRQMGELGLFGLPFPEEYGGAGGTYFDLCVALEELARVDSSMAITVEAGVSLGAMPIYRFGTEEQKQEWLPRLCAGEALGAFGLTEPGGGSDAGATRPPRAWRTGTGSSTARRRSSPTPAPTSPSWSRSPRSPARGRTAARRSRRSSCRRARRASPSASGTPRSAGTPRTPVAHQPVQRVDVQLLDVLARVALCLLAVQLDERVACAPHRTARRWLRHPAPPSPIVHT